MPTFDSPGPISADFTLSMGDLTVVASDRTDTVVTVTAHRGDDRTDRRWAAQTRVEFTDGRLVVRTPKAKPIIISNERGMVDVHVELPTGSSLQAVTYHGEISVTGTVGDAQLKTYDGDVTLHRAGAVKLTTYNGRISADRVAGDANIYGSGSVELTEVTGAARVKNLNGPSWIGQAGGEVSVNSAHGDITIERAGPKVTARTAYGKVHLADVTRGSANLKSASGDIEVGIHSGTAAWMDVKSSMGLVRNELDVSTEAPTADTGEQVEIHARTWDGDIVIRRAA